MKTLKTLYFISFLEGSALMASEVLGAKIMSPYYGSSLIVWTNVFICTLTGLALGYFIGAKLAMRKNLELCLISLLTFSFLYFIIMTPLSTYIMEKTLDLSINLGSFLSVFVFLFPLLTSFGTMSPVIIQLLSKNETEAGSKSGRIYAISTLGGIIATLFFGFYFIPVLGVKTSVLTASGLTLIALSLMLYYNQTKSV